MSSKQHRNLNANPADTEALESLRHMTTWARQQAAPMESRMDERQFGFLVDGFAIGATAFHPGPYVPAIDLGSETLPLETMPHRPSLAFRAVQAIGHGAKRVWHAYRRHREIAGAAAVLSAMDDRSLADIGISREDIGHAARHGRNWNGWR